MSSPFSLAATRNAVLGVLGLVFIASAGCASWTPTTEPTKPGIEATDETFSKPVRPELQDEKLPWYDMRNILDPRSREIERRLGA